MKVSIIWLIISVVAVVASVPLQIGAYFINHALFIYLFLLTPLLFCGGVTTIIFMAIRIKRLLIIRKVIKFGTPGIGYFEGNQRFSHNMSAVLPYSGHVSFFAGATITFSYKDECGVPHITTTFKGYTKPQIQHLKTKGQFKILFYQKHAVIDEDLRGLTQASFSRAAVSTDSSRAPQTGGATFVQQKPPVEPCRYCGLKLPPSALKCSGCTGPA